jgi:serine/threonine-protein kinase
MGTVYVGVEAASAEGQRNASQDVDQAVRPPQIAAIKVLAPSLAGEAGFRQRFDAEIESLKKLMHPGIVRLYGFGEEDDFVFYAMEFVDGPSLEDELQAGRRYRWRETAELAIQIARALRHAHDSGVIHRDLKPANLLLADDEHIKLSDFGIARLFGQRLTGSGGVIGTAEYMAPEQADGRPVTPRCDLYSLGCVMYAMLAGRPPFRAKSMPEMLDRHRHETPAGVRQFAPDVPADLERIIARLLEKSPDARYATAQAVARDLEAMIDRLTLGSSRAQPVTPAASQVAVDGSHEPRSAANGRSDSDARHMRFSEGKATATINKPALHEGEAPPRSRFELLPPLTAQAERKSFWRFLVPALPTAVALALIVILIVVLLRGPSDDELFAEIQAAAASDDSTALTAKQTSIEALLARLDDDDPRTEQLRDFQMAIELARVERRLARRTIPAVVDGNDSLVERLLVDAVRIAAVDPQRGVNQLELIVELYGASEEKSAAARQAVTIAKKHLQRLRPLAARRVADHRALLADALARAEQIRTHDEPAARRIWQALIKQYEGEPWAVELLRPAREGLARRENADADRSNNPSESLR